MASPDSVIRPPSRGEKEGVVVINGRGLCGVYNVVLTLKNNSLTILSLACAVKSHHILIPNSSTILAAKYSPLGDIVILVGGASSVMQSTSCPLGTSHVLMVQSIPAVINHRPSQVKH